VNYWLVTAVSPAPGSQLRVEVDYYIGNVRSSSGYYTTAAVVLDYSVYPPAGINVSASFTVGMKYAVDFANNTAALDYILNGTEGSGLYRRGGGGRVYSF